MSWFLNNDDRLTHSDLPQESIDTLFSYPYPASFWSLGEDDVLTLNNQYITLQPEPINSAILEPPYPASFWYYDTEKDRLNLALLPEELISGAFNYCTSLAYVSIPSSVKSIGRYSFAHTALTKVRIAQDCVYYPTSFPAGCEICFYDDEVEPIESYSKAETDALLSAKQSAINTDNKLDPDYISYDSYHRAVSDTEKAYWNSKQDALDSNQTAAVNSGIDSIKVAQIATLTALVSDLTDRVEALENA